MQSSFNRESFERKIQQVYDAIEIGDMKNAMRHINKFLDKGEKKMHQTEKLAYRIVKVYVLDKSNKRQEALQNADEIIKEIKDTKVTDSALLDQLDVILQEIDCFDKIPVQLRESLATSGNIEQQIAQTQKLFTLYTYQNDFAKMSQKATKLSQLISTNPDYVLHSVQSMYLNSQQKGALPSLVDMAIFLLEKQRASRSANNAVLPQYFVQLYTKILLRKGQYDKVIEFLNTHQQSFGIQLDRRRLIFKTLYLKGDKIGAINELLTIIKENYGNIDQYQSLYDIHELAISLIVNHLKEKDIKIDLNFIEQELDNSVIQEETQLFQAFGDQGLLDNLKNLYGSFKKYESVNLDNKTTAVHNCRKASMLSQLLIKEKLFAIVLDNQQKKAYYDKGDQHFIDGLIQYAERYIELQSMIFDLFPFIPLLNQQSKDQIINNLNQKVETIEDKTRQARGLISVFKLKHVFGLNGIQDEELALKTVNQIHFEYLRILELDSKPEKGERKIADDLVILINEILEPLSKIGNMDTFVLYRIGLLEYGLERSPYNFDIQLQLAKIYDELGLSTSFTQHINGLGLKGVQLESLGYLQFRHSIDWLDFNILKQFTIKYNKYQKYNFKNLKECKQRSFNDNNYDQTENFIEYEEFLVNSYFWQLIKFSNQLLEFQENIGTQDEFYKNFFGNMIDQLIISNKQITDFNSDKAYAKKTRTQDLRISDKQFGIVNDYTKIQNERDWFKEFDKDDYLREVTKNDSIQAFFKFDRKNNYKSNLLNSLGFLEHPQVFSILHNLFVTIGQIQNPKADLQKIIEDFTQYFEVQQKTLAELDFESRKDVGERYVDSYKLLINLISYNTQILRLILKVSQINKKEGEAADEALKQLVTLKPQVDSLLAGSQVLSNESSNLRQTCLKALFTSTYLSISYGTLSSYIKGLLPSSKKKKAKGPNQVFEEAQVAVINPLKQLLKDHCQAFGEIKGQIPSDEELEKSYQKLKDLQFYSESSNENRHLDEIVKRKIQEIIKEQKLANDRVKEIGVQISKRFKELSAQGFQ